MTAVDPRMRTAPRGSSLAVLAEAAEARFGYQSSLVFEGIEQTSAQLGARARRFAAGLASLGVHRGDRVAVCMANCPEVLQSYQAIWRIGAVVTPLLFLLGEDELRFALRDSGAVVALTTPEFLPKVRAAACGRDMRCVVTGAAVDGVASFDDMPNGSECRSARWYRPCCGCSLRSRSSPTTCPACAGW